MRKEGKTRKYKWEDVTDAFSESQRHYNGTYLEIDEVYDSTVEVSLFSSPDDSYEIYVSYGKLYGIVYVSPEEAYKIREDIKADLEKVYKESEEPSWEYIDWFIDKYDMQLPMDIFFDFSGMFK